MPSGTPHRTAPRNVAGSAESIVIDGIPVTELESSMHPAKSHDKLRRSAARAKIIGAPV